MARRRNHSPHLSSRPGHRMSGPATALLATNPLNWHEIVPHTVQGPDPAWTHNGIESQFHWNVKIKGENDSFTIWKPAQARLNFLSLKNLKGLSETAVEILNCFKSSPEKKLKVADLETSTELPRRTIQFSLKALVDQEFLQRLGKGAGTRYQLVFWKWITSEL